MLDISDNADIESDVSRTIVNRGGNITITGGIIKLNVTNTGTALMNTSGTTKMSNGEINSTGYGLVVDGDTVKTTGGKIRSESTSTGPAVCIRNNGEKVELINTEIIRELTSEGKRPAVENAKEVPKYGDIIIRNRSANYGVTGNCTGGVVATTNTSPGQSSEKVTIYYGESTHYLFPTWTAKNGQDDIDWMKSYSSNGTHTVTIYKSAHNSETGTYNVHIYKASGNYEAGDLMGAITLNF